MKKLFSLLFLFTLLLSACSLPSEATESLQIISSETDANDVQIVLEDAAPAASVDSSIAPTVTTGEAGYLFAPIGSTTTYLMNAAGETMQSWESDYRPGHSVYLRENGNLLHTGSVRSTVFGAGGAGGIVEEIAADGTIIWSYQYANDQVQQHHDIEELPNGNILMIAWEIF